MSATIREVEPDDPRLEGLDAFARAHATGEPSPTFAPSLPDEGARQRAADEARAAAQGPRSIRTPFQRRGVADLDLPDVDPRRLLGGAATAAAVNGLHRAAAAASIGLSAKRRTRLEKALSDLHAALQADT